MEEWSLEAVMIGLGTGEEIFAWAGWGLRMPFILCIVHRDTNGCSGLETRICY